MAPACCTVLNWTARLFALMDTFSTSSKLFITMFILVALTRSGLISKPKKLVEARILDKDGYTICPLCLKHISAKGFCARIQQAEGRNVPDLTVTEVSLFHIRELRTGEFNHKPYNLGWGHHHCNVVVKDAGIDATLEWMREVIARNDAQ